MTTCLADDDVYQVSSRRDSRKALDMRVLKANGCIVRYLYLPTQFALNSLYAFFDETGDEVVSPNTLKIGICDSPSEGFLPLSM